MSTTAMLEHDTENNYWNVVLYNVWNQDPFIVVECHTEAHARKLLSTIAECSPGTEIVDE